MCGLVKMRFVASTITTVIFLFSLAIPFETYAAFKMGDMQCAASQCNPSNPKGPPCASITCFDTTNGIKTTGICVNSSPGFCKGTGFEGPGGDMKGIEGALGKMLETLMGKLMEAMKGKQGGGGQQGGGAGATPSQLYPACVRNTATNTVSPIPCTETNGTVNYGTGTTGTTGTGSINGNTSDILLNALDGGSGSIETGAPATTTNTNVNTNSNTNSVTTDVTTPTQSTVIIQGGQAGVQPSSQLSQQQGMLQGDIVVGGTGGMLYVRSRDPQSNTEVAGFFGGNTIGQQQSSSLIGNMCSTRPWSGGLLGGLITPGFFDGLCQRFGYQVGAIPVTSSGTGSVVPRKPTITITQQPVTPAVGAEPAVLQPMADIWANPASVRLGARTYIFWSTRDVESCVVSGPSFSHNTLSGGASTVPLSDASTFTIECKTADSQTVRDSVRVNLAL